MQLTGICTCEDGVGPGWYIRWMRRRALSPILQAAIIGTLLALLVQLAACTVDRRLPAIRTSVIAVNALRDGFTEWDKQHQLEIVDKAETKEQMDAAVAAYLAKRQPVERGFELVYRALVVAATETDDFTLQTALSAAKDIQAAVAALKEGK